jgi:hypothetical protein
LKTNSWNNTARIAPPNGTSPYNQTHLKPGPPSLKSIIKLVPNAIAGFRQEPVAVRWLPAHIVLAATYEAAMIKHVNDFSLENLVFSSV